LDFSQYTSFSASGWRGWIANEWKQHLTPTDPLIALREPPHEMIKDRPSSRLWKVEFGDESIFVKYMTAANDRRRSFMDDLKWRYRPSRAIAMLKVTIRMSAAGLHVPYILFAARRRHAGLTEDLLVMREVQGTTLAEFLQINPIAAKAHQILSMVGQRIAQLHQLRIMHGDLLPQNLILIDDENNLVWLDNDRTRVKTGFMPPHIYQRNLAQIIYRLLSDYSWRDTKPLLEGYFDQMGWSGKRRRRAIALAIKKARLRKWPRTGMKPLDSRP